MSGTQEGFESPPTHERPMREITAKFFLRIGEIDIVKRLKILSWIIAAALLTGCSAISEGRITDKTYEPAHTTRSWECQFWSSDAKGNMRCMFYGWKEYHHAATYRFDIADGEDTGWVYVDQYKFESHSVGDWYGEENN